MAKLFPNGICLFLIVICLTKTTRTMLTVPTELSDEENTNNCPLVVIQRIVLRNRTLTLVNINNNAFLTQLHLFSFKILTRTFLATKINEPNEAYILQCENFTECDDGIGDLVKDHHWNPAAAFIIVIRNFYSGQTNIFNIFEKLHRLYVFKMIIVTYSYVYLYNFDIADHCFFTPRAITEYECKILMNSPSQASIWTDIVKPFQDRPKIPYSACNMSVMVSVIPPFVFSPDTDSLEPTGYEEEFINVLKRINFTNLSFTYNTEATSTGTVHDNFTVTGVLKELQMDHIDYFLGGTLLSHYRLGPFDFTYPHFCDDFKLIVPKARQVDKWEVMYKVFKPLVWGLIFLAFLCGILVAFMLKIHGQQDFKGCVLTTLYLFAYLTNNAAKQRAGVFILSWAFFAWLITCFYQSDLASIFTKPVYYNDVDSFDEILKRGFQLYLSKAKYSYMQGSKDLNLGGVLNSSIITNSDLHSLQTVASREKRYTLVSRLSFRYYDSEFYRNDGEPMLHDIIEPYFYVFRTGYLKKGNPNLKRIRFLERQVITFSFHRRSLLAYIHMNKLKHLKVDKILSRPLTCTSIAGLYYIFLCGCAISFITFLIEIVVAIDKIAFGKILTKLLDVRNCYIQSDLS
ncbi:uncharacterized protein [Choristoneura fumiferana]|uniref:uncharacterized protein n=1 Tax=Choristoneura fumiferana TaxID=7141 RepID=UPI003D15806F